jgi:hypothetical protein
MDNAKYNQQNLNDIPEPFRGQHFTTPIYENKITTPSTPTHTPTHKAQSSGFGGQDLLFLFFLLLLFSDYK